MTGFDKDASSWIQPPPGMNSSPVAVGFPPADPGPGLSVCSLPSYGMMVSCWMTMVDRSIISGVRQTAWISGGRVSEFAFQQRARAVPGSSSS